MSHHNPATWRLVVVSLFLFSSFSQAKVILRQLMLSQHLRWEIDEKLGLDPRRRVRTQYQDMLSIWSREDAGETISFETTSWGTFVGQFSKIKIFELELETCKEKEGELKVIVEKAKNWKFPMASETQIIAESHHEMRYLVAKANNVEWRSWRGPRCMLSDARTHDEHGPELLVAKIVYKPAIR